ncbi:hypothetical protein Lal_00013387 [Lupinus albus]|nr:hypothetical protein Lal_00013387 [Lupinus albus]
MSTFCKFLSSSNKFNVGVAYNGTFIKVRSLLHYKAELWVLFQRIRLVHFLGHNKLMVELNSKVLLKMVKGA